MAAAGPVPPCAGPDAPVDPPYGEVDGQPRVAVWHDANLALPPGCPRKLEGRFALVVALSGRFTTTEGLQGIAGRTGAISKMRGLPYWSVTEGRWRTLVDDAYALRGRDGSTARADFSAREVLSGKTLWFSQDDSRSSGRNVYAFRTLQASETGFVFESYNATPIRLFFVTLFEAESLWSFHDLRRAENGEWRYYGLSLIRTDGAGGQERSLVNRAVSYYRYLAGQPADGAPPLAP